MFRLLHDITIFKYPNLIPFYLLVKKLVWSDGTIMAFFMENLPQWPGCRAAWFGNNEGCWYNVQGQNRWPNKGRPRQDKGRRIGSIKEHTSFAGISISMRLRPRLRSVRDGLRWMRSLRCLEAEILRSCDRSYLKYGRMVSYSHVEKDF